MRSCVVFSLVASAALAFSASAQQGNGENAISVPVPTISETSRAEPDWYRQFTIVAPPSTFENNPALQTSPNQDISLNWADAGRWQFSIDLTSRPEDSPLPREQMSAGATFKITPRFSVGGDLSVASSELEKTQVFTGEDVETGVRFRSAFKF